MAFALKYKIINCVVYFWNEKQKVYIFGLLNLRHVNFLKNV
jgi:hypothetical protein